MYHTIIIVGNLGRDPEMRFTPGGTAVTNLNVASTRKYTGNDGNLVEETCWFRVSVWGKQAESCNQYLRKGRPVLIEGHLRPDLATGGPRVFTRQDGTSGATYEVNALTVRFLPGRGDEDRGFAPGEATEGFQMSDSDDIPF